MVEKNWSEGEIEAGESTNTREEKIAVYQVHLRLQFSSLWMQLDRWNASGGEARNA
jgi:hypothetical protein